MNFHKYSQKLIILMAAIWLILAITKPVSLSFLYIFFGIIVFYLGIQNVILLNIAYKTNTMPEKVTYYEQKFGEKYGFIYYLVLSIGVYLISGLIIIISGFFV